MGDGFFAPGTLDVIIVVPPISPSETNPPLGPAILRSVIDDHRLTATVVDLNIAYLSDFKGRTPVRQALALGDHGKDRAMVATAAEQFFRDTGLRDRPPLYAPDTADPAAGMHVGFAAVADALATGLAAIWGQWLDVHLFNVAVAAPKVLGISIMGPSQVFMALAIATMSKRRWPETRTVFGGSHVTLLAELIARDERYRRHVDDVLPGHSEYEFAQYVLKTASRSSADVATTPGAFPYLPLFADEELAPFDHDTLTLPLQFTRGCAYGRCTFCTYPVVEPVLTSFDAARARSAIATLVHRHGVRRFSVKDSLFTVPMMLSLAEALLERGPAIRWSATTKVTRGLARHADRLAESGLATLEIGVETIHQAGQLLIDKRARRQMIEDVLLACAEAGITVVVNLIFGLPGETVHDADRQLTWFLDLVRVGPPGRIEGSLNMLEIVRGSPLARRPPPGVELLGIAPWAYCYAWNAPTWRPAYAADLRTVEMRSNVR